MGTRYIVVLEQGGVDTMAFAVGRHDEESFEECVQRGLNRFSVRSDGAVNDLLLDSPVNWAGGVGTGWVKEHSTGTHWKMTVETNNIFF